MADKTSQAPKESDQWTWIDSNDESSADISFTGLSPSRDSGSATQFVPPGFVELQAKMVAQGLCTAEEWRQAIARAGDDADQRQILVALSDVQRERDRGWGKPPLTPFQIETIQSGRIDRLSMNHHLVLDEISANGHGGFYRAWNRNLARIEAIKTISVEPIADESDLQRQLRTRRLLQKVEGLARLTHQQIPKVYHAGELDGGLCIVTEYVEGENVRTLVREAERKGEAFSLSWVAARIFDIADAIHYAHGEGMVHTEIGPRNVIITTQGGAKLLNLGLANLFDAFGTSAPSTQTRDAEMQAALAPELWETDVPPNPATDVYALGCLFYFLLTGKQPFSGLRNDQLMHACLTEAAPSVTSSRPDLPRSLDKLFARLLAKDPAQRMTCEQLLRELPAYFHWQRQSRSPWLPCAAAAVFAVSVAAFTFVWYKLEPAADAAKQTRQDVVPTANLERDVSTPPVEKPIARGGESSRIRLVRLEQFQAENGDVWSSVEQIERFLSERDREDASDAVLESETWRRRQLRFLAAHQSEHPEVWPDLKMLRETAGLQPIRVNSEFTQWRRQVAGLTEAGYGRVWSDWVDDFVSQNADIFASRRSLLQNVRLPAVTDRASLTSAREAAEAALAERVNPFRAGPDFDSTPDIERLVQAYRWRWNLPDAGFRPGQVFARFSVDGERPFRPQSGQRIEVQVRVERPGYLVATVFESHGKQLFIQTDRPVQPGEWTSLFTLVAEEPGRDEMVFLLADAPPLPVDVTPVGEGNGPELISCMIGPEDRETFESRFVSPESYQRALRLFRDDATIPRRPTVDDSSPTWHSSTTLILDWE